MAKRDIMELQKRMRPDEHNITWVVTALVEPDGTVESVNKERLVSMREEEYFKYLSKIKSIFPYKKYGDAVLQMDINALHCELCEYMRDEIRTGMNDIEAISLMIEVVKEAAACNCNVTISKDGKEVDAKRILGVMGLGVKCGQEIILKTEGDGEEEAMEKLSAFLEANL